MIDFLMISSRSTKRGVIEIYPKFIIKKSSDLMIRGGDFYAIWIEERGMWSTSEQDALDLIDRELDIYAKENRSRFDSDIRVLHMWDSENGMIDRWHKYCQKHMRDDYRMLDEKLIFANTETNKKDYASKKLPYPLEPGECPAYTKLISTIYTEKEKHKIEWCIGAIVSGASKKLQKFMVLYGAAGTGKSTIINIIQQLFDGYCSVFDAKALGSSNSVFALESFRTNPLVAIQHDGDLSRIEDNTRLNSLVSHEVMTVNEKFKATYANDFKSFLIMGTNKPVKITDAKSGILRRLIDVTPSGNKVDPSEYKQIMKQIGFELGAIAYHCQQVYLENPGAYDDYLPAMMMSATNDFYNFVLDSYHIFKNEDGVSLTIAWKMYREYCEEAKVPYPFSQRSFKEELKNYFYEFDERITLNGDRIRSYYSGFRIDKFQSDISEEVKEEEKPVENLIKFEESSSLFDILRGDCFAQYANENGTPSMKWEKVTSKLSQIDTSKLHYVKVPENHIVIDFDIKDEDGNKSYEKNLAEASKWPPTYAELSKSGAGIHLHYIYTGDVSKLSRIYDDNIEIKYFTGKSALRRKLTKCNHLPVAPISSGLPLKGENKLVNFEGIKSEKVLRTMIKRNLNKEYHAGTKPSIDFIYKILEEAYEGGLGYDVTDLRNAVLAFAANSTNQADYCIKLVNKMHFRSAEPSVDIRDNEADIVFYDVEVFPNLFLVNWKRRGKDKPVVRLINPKPFEIEELMQFRLVGFNCRRYDNHILYARMMGKTNEELYDLSQKIIGGDRNAFFGEAYNVSYTDVYDFAAIKQSLKKWEIELGIHHQELGLPWDQPVPEERWVEVAEYCDNDVLATEAVFDYLAGDWTARQILADLADMTVNDTTNSLTTRIIFGKERNPKLVYTDLATGEQFGNDGPAPNVINAFPGYEFVYDESDKKYHNMYRGVDMGFGGYVYAEPGMYGNVALLDVQSMHPNSAVNLNAFGEYTKHFKDILDARVAIKHGDYDAARGMFGGKLAPYLENKENASALAQALKIAINSVYGLTSANFDNPFRDNRNKNNIVALRGALFMKTLQDEVQRRGFIVAHVKTDSIKIPDATPEIIEFVMEFGRKYGYIFEHEATYDRMCLVNDAVYIAKYKDGKHAGEWTATGTQFAVPYVFKKLFSKEDILFEDMCETKSVATALYLDNNESLPDVTEYEAVQALRRNGKSIDDMSKKDVDLLYLYRYISDDELDAMIATGHDYMFVGKVGSFCPIRSGCGGSELVREGKDKNGNVKFSSATGAKGYRWLEAEVVRLLGKENLIDRSYYDKLVNDAVDAISVHGNFEWFVSDDPYTGPEYDQYGRPVYYPEEDTCPFDLR